MRQFLPILALMTAVSSCNNQLEYPVTKKQNVTDNYYGTEVEDPYRWLEDDYSAETMAWVKEQNAFTQSYLQKLGGKQAIKQRLSEVWNSERIS